ncbi:MAG: hypothetical protein IJT75_09935 [Bacteroidaceae bacterium]|nr:hypothetical protein [Bacteroidaceae bacterium]
MIIGYGNGFAAAKLALFPEGAKLLNKKVQNNLAVPAESHTFAPRNHHTQQSHRATPSGITGLLHSFICNTPDGQSPLAEPDAFFVLLKICCR